MSSLSSVPEQFPAFIATKTTDADGKPAVERGVGLLAASDLSAGEVTIRVHWSSVNYKDALATTADGGVARLSPLVAGVDVAGIVVAVDGEASVKVGDEVLAHGTDIGTGRHGGYAHYCRLAASTVLKVPAGLTMREAMIIGTAGFTAAQSVHALERHGIRTDGGPVLVTGATGGVGSAAIGILAQRGYEVVASTGKASETEFLSQLGATSVIERAETSAESNRPLEKERWGAVVDCVGGSTLAYAIRTLKYGGAIAASGLTGGASLPTTVLPFILRGVTLLGIDSVSIDRVTREEIWHRCAADLKPRKLDAIAHEIGLNGLEAALTSVRAGNTRGRALVNLDA
jgi:acrylyl-CoA reductase (NADPH)